MPAGIKMINDERFDTLLHFLNDLDGIQQSAQYHPEGDALFHSLQVYQCAKHDTQDPELLAAALLHDIGKAADCNCHALWGAEALDTYCTAKVCWLVAHHLDLLKASKKQQGRLQSHPWFKDLSTLRRWDLAGRDPDAYVMSVDDALNELFQNPSFLLSNAAISL